MTDEEIRKEKRLETDESLIFQFVLWKSRTFENINFDATVYFNDCPLWLKRPSTIFLDRSVCLKTVHFLTDRVKLRDRALLGPSTLDLTPNKSPALAMIIMAIYLLSFLYRFQRNKSNQQTKNQTFTGYCIQDPGYVNHCIL